MPDPTNFEIIDWYSGKNATVVKIKYPNCTNFEGRKILVYGASIEEINNAKFLDLVPIARFEPTSFGLELAIKLVMMLDEK